MSNRQSDLIDLRQQLINAETEIIDRNRQITAAIGAQRPTADLAAELNEIIEARDFLKARLARLEGEHNG